MPNTPSAIRFKNAQHHTKRVWWLRRLLPMIGVVGIVAFLGFSFLKQQAGLDLGLKGLKIDSTGITMERPHLSGHDKGGRKYEVNAISARQELGKPKQMWLDDLVATIELPKNGWMKITAATGLYDGELETLNLQKNIRAISHLGYTVDLQHAYIELKNGVIRSDKNVNITTDSADTIAADSMQVEKGGEVLKFNGRVHMNLQGGMPNTPEQQ